MTIILGVDPGLHTTGYGIIQYSSNNITYLNSGLIKTLPNYLPNRLKLIFDRLNEVINNHKPEIFVIEKIFFAKNADTAIKLSQASGVAMVSAVSNELPVFEYTTKQVKHTVVGTGSATKNQVQYMVCTLLKITISLPEDAADALAIAITHCYITYKSS